MSVFLLLVLFLLLGHFRGRERTTREEDDFGFLREDNGVSWSKQGQKGNV
jgi:hypothetical protein